MSNITKGDNAKSKKGRVIILVCDMSSHPVLHFCQIPSTYSKASSSYRADKKLILKKGDNFKNKTARVVILVRDTSSRLVQHFYQASKNILKGFQLTERTQNQCMEITPIIIKPELSFLYATHRPVLFYVSTKYNQNISKGFRVTERTQNLFQTKQRK